MACDNINNSSIFDDVRNCLNVVDLNYNKVFEDRDPVKKIEEYIQGSEKQRFPFLDDDTFSRCGSINVTFIRPNQPPATIKLEDKDKLEEHLKTVSGENEKPLLLTQFFLSQDGYFWPSAELGMNLQMEGLPVNIPSMPPKSIKVIGDKEGKNIVVSYGFERSVKNMKNTENDPQGEPIGTLIHKFGYRINCETNTVKLSSKSVCLKKMAPFKMIKDHFSASKGVPLPTAPIMCEQGNDFALRCFSRLR